MEHVWIQTGKIQQGLIKRSGIEKELLDAGVFLINDTCINNFQMSGWNFDTIVTNSGKMAHYAPGTTGGKIFFANLKECVNAAVEGKVVL